MSENISRCVAYLLDDVLQKKFDKGFYQEELWDYVERHEKPVLEYAMEDVKHWIYVPCWSYTLAHTTETEDVDPEECFISIYQVLLQQKVFGEHMQRIKQADLHYPLIVVEDDFDRFGVILDGNHRFAKLLMSGAKKVKIQFIGKQELLQNLYREI